MAKIENCLEVSGSRADLAQLITEFYVKNNFMLIKREDDRYFQLEQNLRTKSDEIELELWIKASNIPSTNLLIFSHAFPKLLHINHDHTESIYQEIVSLYQFISAEIPQKTDKIDDGYEASVCGTELEAEFPPTCVICRRPVLENLIKTPCCGVYAHAPHLQEWLRMKGTCPLCREKLQERDLFKEKDFGGKKEGRFISVPWCPKCYLYKGNSSVCPHCMYYEP